MGFIADEPLAKAVADQEKHINGPVEFLRLLGIKETKGLIREKSAETGLPGEFKFADGGAVASVLSLVGERSPETIIPIPIEWGSPARYAPRRTKEIHVAGERVKRLI